MTNTIVSAWRVPYSLRIKYPEYGKGCDIMYFIQEYLPKDIIGFILDYSLGHGSICITDSYPEKCFVCSGHTLECNQLRKNGQCFYCQTENRYIIWCIGCQLIKKDIWIETHRTSFDYQVTECFRADCVVCIKKKNYIDLISGWDNHSNDLYLCIEEYVDYINKYKNKGEPMMY